MKIPKLTQGQIQRLEAEARAVYYRASGKDAYEREIFEILNRYENSRLPKHMVDTKNENSP